MISSRTPSNSRRPTEPKPQITFEEFAKGDLRVAKILTCEPHPSADRLWKLSLDDGSGTPRQICAGIRQYYTPAQLVGRSIIIVANLAPRVIRGEESRGMLLAASNAPKDAADTDRRNETGNPAQEAIGGVGEVSGEGTREVEVVTQQRP